eukprot:7379510-Pyramimonas_sp.AAC.1
MTDSCCQSCVIWLPASAATFIYRTVDAQATWRRVCGNVHAAQAMRRSQCGARSGLQPMRCNLRDAHAAPTGGHQPKLRHARAHHHTHAHRPGDVNAATART